MSIPPRSITGRRLKRAMTGAAMALALLGGLPEASAETRTITAVMHSGVRVLDPIITTAHITRNHGYMIYDTLLALDETFTPQPQMAEWAISDDKLTYTFTLRDGLKWHDGTPVTAEDCVASLKRWAVRDTGGQLIMDVTASLEAADHKTIVWTLKEPFPYVLEILAKPSSLVAFMMPKRVAETSADTAITEHVGSGPFVFVEEEYQPGVKVVYAKFEGYVPRAEPPSWAAGGKAVHVDRVEWVTMPDAQTAVNALGSGEIDFLEQPSVDLLPLIEANDELVVASKAKLGFQTMGRMNFLHPPFDDPKIRKAALLAMNQKDVLDAQIGNPGYYTICGAVFGCGTPLASETGAETLIAQGDVEAAKALLKEAGYDGTPVVLMQPTDINSIKGQPVVAAQALRAAGFTVDMQAMDWQTLVTRRANPAPPAEGGWNLFFTNWIVPEIMTPLNNVMLNGRGKDAWFGWPDDPKLEALRAAYVKAETAEEQKDIAARIQAYALEEVIYIPLGQYLQPWAFRKGLTGIIEAPFPLFWNVEKEG